MTTTGWLIYEKTNAQDNSSFIDWFIEEAKKQQLYLRFVYREDLQIGVVHNHLSIQINNSPVPLPDFAVVRTIEPLLNLHLETLGVHVFNSAKIATICNDKARTHFEICRLRIPMVDTLFVKQSHLHQIPPLSFPFVVKTIDGHGGKDVFLIKDDKQWKTFLTSSSSNSQLILQTCHVQHGKDVRVFVVGKEIVGAVLRKSDSDFRANFKLGGTAEWYHLNSAEKEMINKIVNHFDFGMVGIDFLVAENGDLLFNEIEDVVGSRTLSNVSEINLLEKYISFIKFQLKNRAQRD